MSTKIKEITLSRYIYFLNCYITYLIYKFQIYSSSSYGKYNNICRNYEKTLLKLFKFIESSKQLENVYLTEKIDNAKS